MLRRTADSRRISSRQTRPKASTARAVQPQEAACVCSVCVACVLVTPAARCLLLQYTYRLRVILRHNIAVEFKGEIKRKSGAM